MTYDALTAEEVQTDPSAVVRSFQLPSGVTATFRPLLSADSQRLGEYFLGLSPETRSRFGPHPLDRATANHLCASIHVAEALRMIAVIANPEEQIIAYCILLLSVTEHELARYARYGTILDARTDCTVAPSVADAYQNLGLGSPFLLHLIEVARRLGRQRMVLLGGVQATNQRAVHFYRKHHFQMAGSFEWPAGVFNHDMLLKL